MCAYFELDLAYISLPSDENVENGNEERWTFIAAIGSCIHCESFFSDASNPMIETAYNRRECEPRLLASDSIA